MKTNITTASNQWAVRPADQRFWTLTELYERTKQYAKESVVKTLPLNKCEVIPVDADLRLKGPAGNTAQFQHYSFGQLAGLCRAPATYLRDLPSELAAANLNYGLKRMSGEQTLMFHQNGGLHLRCVTSSIYERIWNYEIAGLGLMLEDQGWRTPPARSPERDPGECTTTASRIPTRIATEADILRVSAHPQLGIKVGDTISPSGLYASDHDCFIFQVNEDTAIEGGDGETLYRGVFWSNSEVGQAKFRATMFLYESICGNHIVWGAKVLAEVAIRHTGDARRAFAEAMQTITARSQRAASEDVKLIQASKNHLLGATKEEVIQMVFKKNLGLGLKECEDSYVIADRYADYHGKNPNSAWGFAAGVTRLSQAQPYQDERNRMDRAAGRVLSMAF